MGQDESTIESVVCDEFSKRLSHTSEDEMVQLDHREYSAERAIRAYQNSHLALNREIRESTARHAIAVLVDLALE